jgi:hypothetical protein
MKDETATLLIRWSFAIGTFASLAWVLVYFVALKPVVDAWTMRHLGLALHRGHVLLIIAPPALMATSVYSLWSAGVPLPRRHPMDGR